MSESDYTVVSNISRYGMAPVEAGSKTCCKRAESKDKQKKACCLRGQQVFYLVSVSGGCGAL